MTVVIIAMVVLLIALSWWLLGKLVPVLINNEIVDHPNDRTLHKGAVPRGGGLIIVGGLLLGLLGITVVSGEYVFFGVLTLLMLGWAGVSWVDDRRSLSPQFRLLTQLILALATILAFGWVERVSGVNLHWFGPLLSLVGLVWMANLYNFMDGLDGLAGSQSVIASVTLSYWFYSSGALYLTGLCLLVSACSCGFLLRNWNPAQVFMGDVGSITLGAFFGSLLIIGVSHYQLPVLSFIVLFAVFIVDATVTISLRAYRGEKIWLPHRQHFYQRLANAGYDHANIALSAAALMILCSLLATFGIAYRDMMGASIISVLSLIFIAVFLVIKLEKKADAAKHNNP